MSIFNIIALFGGLSLFLYGMRIMGDELKSNATGALKTALEKLTGTTVGGFTMGVLFTALIQSSKATIVLTSGLVGAEIISLHQSIGIILGANVGTTVTGQIIRLLDVDASPNSFMNFFKPATLAPLACTIGMLFIMFIKSKNSKTFGGIFMGFGILFTGLMSMTASVSSLSESESFRQGFVTLGLNPILGFLVGLGVAFVLQSQSATVGILQAIAIAGNLNFGIVFPMLLGIYVGDALTTALVCYIGASAEPKRVGVVQVIFNISQVILMFVAVIALKTTGVLGNYWTAAITSGGIANANTILKLAGAVVLLPLTGKFEELSRKIVPDDKKETDEYEEEFARLSENLLRSPGVALSYTFQSLRTMSKVAVENVSRAMNLIWNYDETQADLVDKKEDFVDRMTDAASDYLAKLSPTITVSRRSELLNYYLKCIDEFERIADHAVNLKEDMDKLRSRNAKFSDSALKEMALLNTAVEQIIHYAQTAFSEEDYNAARHIEPIEQVIDNLVEYLREYHLVRLRNGQCNIDSGFVFLDMLVNIERIADQCSNIGIHTVSLFDKTIGDKQHEYARRLESGEDQEYNQELQNLTAQYMAELQLIEKGA